MAYIESVTPAGGDTWRVVWFANDGKRFESVNASLESARQGYAGIPFGSAHAPPPGWAEPHKPPTEVVRHAAPAQTAPKSSLIMNDTPEMRAERARYYAEVPGALWERLSSAERSTFLEGPLSAVRALAAKLGVAPARPKKSREQIELEGIAAMTRSHGPIAAARLVQGLEAARRTALESKNPAAAVASVPAAMARVMGLTPKYIEPKRHAGKHIPGTVFQ